MLAPDVAVFIFNSKSNTQKISSLNIEITIICQLHNSFILECISFSHILSLNLILIQQHRTGCVLIRPQISTYVEPPIRIIVPSGRSKGPRVAPHFSGRPDYPVPICYNRLIVPQ